MGAGSLAVLGPCHPAAHRAEAQFSLFGASVLGFLRNAALVLPGSSHWLRRSAQPGRRLF